MHRHRTTHGLTVNAIAGTRVVLLGFDLSEQRRKKCLGFAIQRVDHATDERVWLRGMKTFAATDPGLGPGGQVSSRDHPFQTFQWADYAVEPGNTYTYRVFALTGTPQHLVEGAPTVVTVTAENEAGNPHSVYFNRGSVATQQYAREFLDTPPDDFTDPVQRDAALRWLSRGLEEALIAFIARATGPEFEIHGAVYEFQWPRALDALRAATGRGVRVNVIYDSIKNQPGTKNLAAIKKAKLEDCVKPRKNGTIMHNKFLVLSKGGVPQAVWTGSTNWTEQGIFGHLNCGHVVQGKKIAQQYRDYWSEVLRDLERDPDRAAVGALAARPPDPWTDKITTSFSPQPSTKVLDWYAKLAGGAQDGLFMTFAFGMNKRFLDVYQHDDDVLKLALMEKEGNGSGLAKAREQIAELRKRPNVVVALGNRIPLNGFDRWLRELDRITSPIQVHWIHSKFALIDPLGDDPIVITGSANFSDGSTNENNENMLIIRGDKRVAEIYLTEFMRLFAHYVFRETVAKRGIWNLKDFNPNNLDPTPAWSDRYFKGGQDQRRREYFSGRRTARLAGHVRARDAARTRAGAPAPGRQAARRPGAGPRRRRRGGRT